MKKEEVIEVIRKMAIEKGFVFVQDNFGWRIRDGESWSESWVNFTAHEDNDWSQIAERKVTTEITFSASIAQMGGNPTVEELFKAADAIRRAAELVEELNSQKLQYVVIY